MELKIFADRQLVALNKDVDTAGEKNQENNAEKRAQKRGDGKLARDGSELEPAIHDK